MNGLIVLAFILVSALSLSTGIFESEGRCGNNCQSLCQIGRTEPPRRGWFSSIRRHRIKREVGRFVYRVIRRDENPTRGLRAKNPQATRSLTSHIRCGGRRNYRSQYISTTKSLRVAERYGGRKRIVKIDTAVAELAGCDIIDLSDAHDLNGVVAQNYARRSQEVLITGCTIPASAITIVRGSVAG